MEIVGVPGWLVPFNICFTADTRSLTVIETEKRYLSMTRFEVRDDNDHVLLSCAATEDCPCPPNFKVVDAKTRAELMNFRVGLNHVNVTGLGVTLKIKVFPGFKRSIITHRFPHNMVLVQAEAPTRFAHRFPILPCRGVVAAQYR